MMFRLNGIDPEKAGDAWRTIPALMEKAEARRHPQVSAQGARSCGRRATASNGE